MSSSHDALYLDFADAKAMQRELDEVWKKYVSRGGTQRYLARVLLVPAREGAPKVD